MKEGISLKFQKYDGHEPITVQITLSYEEAEQLLQQAAADTLQDVSGRTIRTEIERRAE